MFTRPLPDRGANFIAARNLIALMGAWHVKQLEDFDIDMGDIDVDITKVLLDGATTDCDTVTFMLQGSNEYKALKANGNEIIAIGTIKCDDADINSAELFMVLAQKAHELGGTHVVLLGEGVKLELQSSGFGLGMSYNYATINSHAYGQGQVGAGGTGYSKGWASYDKFPYLSFAIVK